VVVDIIADDPRFVPVYSDKNAIHADVFANLGKSTAQLVHRSLVKIDCGFSMRLKPGWQIKAKLTQELASQGVILVGVDSTDRFSLILANVGKNNPVYISDASVVAKISVEPVYYCVWNVVDQ
jgi:dUTPase